jgi:hypothetical protein
MTGANDRIYRSIILLRSLPSAGHYLPSVRYLIQPLVDQSVQAFVFVPVNMPPERPLTYTQQPRRFFLGQTAALPTSIRFFESHFPSLL